MLVVAIVFISLIPRYLRYVCSMLSVSARLVSVGPASLPKITSKNGKACAQLTTNTSAHTNYYCSIFTTLACNISLLSRAITENPELSAHTVKIHATDATDAPVCTNAVYALVLLWSEGPVVRRSCGQKVLWSEGGLCSLMWSNMLSRE